MSTNDLSDGDRVRANDPSLVKLYLSQPPSEYYSDGQIDEFSRALKQNTHVSYVLMERRFVGALKTSPSDYAKLLQAVAQIPNLTELEIWSVRVPLATLCQALQGRYTPNLFRLGLGTVTVTEANLDCSGLANHPNLQYFYLSDFRFLEEEPDKNLDSLWAALGSCPRLFNVEIFNNQNGEGCWTGQGLAHLASSTSLDQLTLRRLDLRTEHVLPFCNRLRANSNQTRLRVLNLLHNTLGDGGCVGVAQAATACGIRELDLRDNHVTAEGIRVVVPLLVTSPATMLEKLNLGFNAMGDEGALVFAQALEDNPRGPLKHLDLARAEISDVGCTRLSQALIINKSLETLGLSYNVIGNDTYLAFGDVLRTQNRTLLSLAVQCNPKELSLPACEALLAAVEENYVLESVSTSLGSSRGYGDEREKASYAYYIRIFLRMNHAGRRKLFEEGGTKAEWINTIIAVQDSLHAIQYLIRSNPSLCERD